MGHGSLKLKSLIGFKFLLQVRGNKEQLSFSTLGHPPGRQPPAHTDSVLFVAHRVAGLVNVCIAGHADHRKLRSLADWLPNQKSRQSFLKLIMDLI